MVHLLNKANIIRQIKLYKRYTNVIWQTLSDTLSNIKDRLIKYGQYYQTN